MFEVTNKDKTYLINLNILQSQHSNSGLTEKHISQ